jgi:hypothetical protein
MNHGRGFLMRKMNFNHEKYLMMCKMMKHQKLLIRLIITFDPDDSTTLLIEHQQRKASTDYLIFILVHSFINITLLFAHPYPCPFI